MSNKKVVISSKNQLYYLFSQGIELFYCKTKITNVEPISGKISTETSPDVLFKAWLPAVNTIDNLLKPV